MAMKLEVDGAGRLVDALSKFNKEIYKELQSEIKQATEAVAADARSRTGETILRNWGAWGMTTGSTGSFGVVSFEQATRDLGWNESRIDRSIRPSVRKTRVRGVQGAAGISGRVQSKDPALAIFGTAGSKTPDSRFNKAIAKKYGSAPQINGKNSTRVLGAALIAKGPQARDDIDRALERAVARFGLN
jgi:hypothetical protein